MATSKKKDVVIPATVDREIAVAEISPATIVQDAIQNGASVEVLEKLLALQERYEANKARKAFDKAMAELRPDLPAIVKNREVSYGQGRTSYKYEDLSGVVEALSPVLAQHGLSFRWRTKSNSANSVTVTCILSHRDGHCEETELTAAHDQSGSKNDIQAMGSSVTYLQRYTLKAALGVAASMDDDGQGAGGPSSQQTGAPRQQQAQQPKPRTVKHEYTQAHIDLEKALDGADRKYGDSMTLLARLSAYTDDRTVVPGVRDVALLTEAECGTIMQKLKNLVAQGEDCRQELGRLIVEYVNGRTAEFINPATKQPDATYGNFMVLEDVTGMKNLQKVEAKTLWKDTITPEIGKRALEKFKKEYLEKQ